MKFKSLYLYLAVGVAVVVFFVTTLVFQNAQKNNEASAGSNKEIPAENINGFQGERGPSGENVSPEFEQKLNELKSEADKSPGDTARLRAYADFIGAAHRTDEAIEVYEKILKIYPRRSDIRMIVASLYYSKQDFTKSEICLNSVLSYEKNNYQAMFNLGVIAAVKGNNDKAKKIWEDLLKKCSDKKLTADTKEALNGLK